MERSQLADFLRRRRAAMQPEDVGFACTARRRTSGLRREEVAMVAGMSSGRGSQDRLGPAGALTIVDTPTVTGGVDTHAGEHVALALNQIGGLLGTSGFPSTPAGYGRLLAWLQSFGPVGLVGVEGTGSYGAGLTRYLTAAGVKVVEVGRVDRQDRYRSGKSDPLDAESAARAALSGKAHGAPRGRDGTVEAIRALMVAKRSARGERTRSINQARALVVTGPDDLRGYGATREGRA